MRPTLLLIAALAALTFTMSLAQADNAEAAVRAVVEAQVAALAAGDAEEAFSYATPDIQKRFGSAENFLVMVRLSYRVLIKAKVFEVEAAEAQGQHGAVRAHVVGKDGKAFKAIYPLLRQPDGTWRIDGCYLQKTDGQSL